MAGKIDTRLKQLGLTLPVASVAVGAPSLSRGAPVEVDAIFEVA
jgi:hypothetical protein